MKLFGLQWMGSNSSNDRAASPKSVMAVEENHEELVRICRLGKEANIWECLSQEPVSLWELRELALSKGGLLNAEIRRKAWPLLVGASSDTSSAVPDSPPLLRHEPPLALSETDRGLIRRDSSRSSLAKFDAALIHGGQPGTSITGKDAEQCLLQILESTLEAAPQYGTMHYYQGLHDIAAVLWYNLGDVSVATSILRQLCHSHLREALRDDHFGALLSFLKSSLLPLLKQFDSELHDILVDDDVMLPSLVFPWIITWFTHDLSDPRVSSRLVDALLCGHSSFVLYLALALLVRHKDQIMDAYYMEDGDPMMVAMLVKTLSSKIGWDYSKTGVSAQVLIDDALEFMEQISPRGIARVAATYHGMDIIESSSFYFRATPSWAVASYPNHTVALLSTTPNPKSYDRAKLASGVAKTRIRALVRQQQLRTPQKVIKSKDIDTSSVASSTCSTRSRSSQKKQVRGGMYRNWWKQSY